MAGEASAAKNRKPDRFAFQVFSFPSDLETKRNPFEAAILKLLSFLKIILTFPQVDNMMIFCSLSTLHVLPFVSADRN